MTCADRAQRAGMKKNDGEEASAWLRAESIRVLGSQWKEQRGQPNGEETRVQPHVQIERAARRQG